jgi:GTP-binding protein
MAQKLPTVAIVGQANVGKSSLFNRIYGAQEAVVAREAGTTRDNVIRKITLESKNPQSFWLVDTAGLKKAEDDFEASIQEQIEEAADAADLIMVVVDGTQYPSDLDRTVAKKALRSKQPVVLVINKTDLKGALPDDEFRRLGISTIIRTSAEHAVNIDTLLHYVIKNIDPVYEDEADNKLRIALIGRPNVGKSNLFNRLAGKQQAIVANVAGTTRDVNHVNVKFEGREVVLLDTAGIRRNGKQQVGIEKFSVLRTLQAIEESDVCCLLMDVNEYGTQLDQKLAGLIKDSGKGLIIVVSKWDSVEKDEKLSDTIAHRITREFAFVPWAPLLFTSSITGQNITKIFDLSRDIDARRKQTFKTSDLNRILMECVRKHPPAGLKNTFPRLRYMVQTDTAPPWFVIFGGNLKLLHWSYKRYLERQMRENYDFAGTPIMFSFRQESGRKEDMDKRKPRD